MEFKSFSFGQFQLISLVDLFISLTFMLKPSSYNINHILWWMNSLALWAHPLWGLGTIVHFVGINN